MGFIHRFPCNNLAQPAGTPANLYNRAIAPSGNAMERSILLPGDPQPTVTPEPFCRPFEAPHPPLTRPCIRGRNRGFRPAPGRLDTDTGTAVGGLYPSFQSGITPALPPPASAFSFPRAGERPAPARGCPLCGSSDRVLKKRGQTSLLKAGACFRVWPNKTSGKGDTGGKRA